MNICVNFSVVTERVKYIENGDSYHLKTAIYSWKYFERINEGRFMNGPLCNPPIRSPGYPLILSLFTSVYTHVSHQVWCIYAGWLRWIWNMVWWVLNITYFIFVVKTIFRYGILVLWFEIIYFAMEFVNVVLFCDTLMSVGGTHLKWWCWYVL